MKREFINKIILGTMISTSLFTLAPTKASAEWGSDYQGNWYYMNNNSKVTGWTKIDGQLYYFDENGAMKKGWIKAGDSWYYLQDNGAVKTGWVNYTNNWYYADSTGAIQTGILNIAGKVYIFDSNGIMKTSNTVINGQFYTISSNGEVVGANIPTPDKELDVAGNVVRILNGNSTTVSGSPTDSKFNEVIEDKTVSKADPNEGRTFEFSFRDYNGAELDTKKVKYGKSVDLYTPTRDGYEFSGWNTKVDGSGKSYDASDSIDVKENTILYAQWSSGVSVYADGITIKGNAYVTVNKTIQMTAEVTPSDASKKTVTWSVTNGTGKATIDSNGVLTGVSAGTVAVTATAKDGSKVSSSKEVTVSVADVTIPVSSIAVTGSTGTSITANGGTLQMAAKLLPAEATNQGITWSIKNNTGSANIDSNGLVTAVSDGTVTVTATANDGSGVTGSATVTISGQTTKIPVESMTIGAKNGSTTMVIDKDGGTLSLVANILPTNATNRTVQWSIIDGEGKAKISSSGVLTALADGTVTVQAKTADGGKVDTKQITISNQSIKVAKITITGPLSISGTAAQTMKATVEGANSTTPTKSTVRWTIENKTGSANIDPNTGALTAISNGTVTVTATATDGSGVTDSKEVTISGASSDVGATEVKVTGKDGSTTPAITKDDGTLDLIATILPSYSTTTSSAVTWDVISGADGGSATLVGNKNGSSTTIKASTNGTVTVRATLTNSDGSVKTGSINVIIDNQIKQAQSIVIDQANNLELGVNETLQMTATVTTLDPKYSKVTWEVSNGSDGGAAIFDSTVNGLLRGLTKGTITVRAISTDGYKLASNPVTVKIVDPRTPTTIKVKSVDDNNNEVNSITTDRGTLKMTSIVDEGLAADVAATNKAVTWSVQSITGKADIVKNSDSTATLTALENGTVKVIATSVSGNVTGEEIIGISGQNPNKLVVSGYNGVNQINMLGGTLQMQYSLDPITATTSSAITWSSSDPTKAIIDQNTGILKAVSNGKVTVTATTTGANKTTATGTADITINAVASVSITGGNVTVANGSMVSLTANILPNTVVGKTVKWTFENADSSDTGVYASSISNGNTLTLQTLSPSPALVAGTKKTIKVTATADDGSGIYGQTFVIITY